MTFVVIEQIQDGDTHGHETRSVTGPFSEEKAIAYAKWLMARWWTEAQKWGNTPEDFELLLEPEKSDGELQCAAYHHSSGDGVKFTVWEIGDPER